MSYSSVEVEHFAEEEFSQLWLRRRSSSLFIYVIPGNPGLVVAYTDFATRLARKYSATVCVCSHRGHTSLSRNLFGLEDQIVHHRRQFALLPNISSYKQILIISHSIGCHIALHLHDPLSSSSSSSSSPPPPSSSSSSRPPLSHLFVCPAISSFRPPRHLLILLLLNAPLLLDLAEHVLLPCLDLFLRVLRWLHQIIDRRLLTNRNLFVANFFFLQHTEMLEELAKGRFHLVR
eukprot:GHVS01019837.1.p1 GENE.GHVS01019837.1~~GHVS01019837.1.p1  ORF type:complete len:233 (+),score=47.78 GHVS01019837.1:95-793(+)